MKLLRNKTLLVLVAGICCIAGYAAVPSQELSEWQKKYPGNALVSIGKQLNITINTDGNSLVTKTEHYREMIVLTENAVFLADSKEYFNSHYTLNKFEAYSLVPDDKQYRKIEVSKYTKTVEIDDYIFYDDQMVYNYTFPAVGKGTKLITRSVATTNYAYVPFIFDFGGRIPGENMSVTLSCPSSVKIIHHLFGNDTSIVRFNQIRKGDRIIYTWQADNPAIYESDDKSPDERYYVPHLIIQVASFNAGGEEMPVLGTLKDLYNYNYSHLSGLSQEPVPELKKLTDSITMGSGTDREKVRNIFRWVQHNIKYVAIEDGENGLVPSTASLVFKRRYGDCKGKTSILVAMLKSQGLKASYAWIGSRTRPYLYSEFPSVVNDDHMIAVWWDGGTPVVLDGTTYSHRMEDVPAFIQGKECMIEKGPDDFVIYTIPVASPRSNAVKDSLVVHIEGNALAGNAVISYYGENKANMIRQFDGKDTSKYCDILSRQLVKASNKNSVKSVSIMDAGMGDSPFVVRYTFVIPDFVTRNGNHVYVNLNPDKFLGQMVINKDRLIPVELSMTQLYNVYCRLEIPAGLKIKSLPANTNYDGPLFSFNETYAEQNQEVVLHSDIILNFQVIQGNDLQNFREMLALLNRNYLKSLSLEKTDTP